jgi:hypothetical protein
LSDPWLVTFDCIASLGGVDDALGTWEATHAVSADARLLELLDRIDVGEATVTIAGVGDYNGNGKAYETLRRWLGSPPVEARICAVLESSRAADCDTADRIDAVLAALKRERPTGP